MNTTSLKCVVTGGSGFIGSHLTQTLLANGWDVTVLDIRQPAIDVKWLPIDIRNDIGDSLKGYDYIFHLAALANARKCGEDPMLCNSTNVLGTVNLLKAARLSQIKRFVLASSAWLSGAQIGEVANEASPFDISRVNTIYGASKLAQETMCISFKSEFGSPDYTIFRYGTPYGERMWRGLVVRAFMQMASSSGTINIMGDGKQTREFLYVGDLCNAQVKITEETTANKIYYLTGDNPVTVESLANEVIKYYPASIEYIPQGRVEPKVTRVLNEKAKSELGWFPKTSLEEGIKKCVDWWESISSKEKEEGYWC